MNEPRKILEDIIVYCYNRFPKLSERLVFGKRLAQEEYECKLKEYVNRHNSHLVIACTLLDHPTWYSKISFGSGLSEYDLAHLYLLKIWALQICASHYGLNIIDEKSRLFELKISSE